MVNPSEFSGELRSHVFAKRAKHIAEQLGNAPQVMEMDRFLAKKPKAVKAEFKWHQDEIYLKVLFARLGTDSVRFNGCYTYWRCLDHGSFIGYTI